MGLSRRGTSREDPPIWPGFVDAMTSLLMVLIFVLTIFMIVQFVLRETITTQDTQLGQLNTQIQNLADALGLEKRKNSELSNTLTAAQRKADEQTTMIATLSSQLAAKSSDLTAAKAKITDFEARVAGLLADKASAQKANDQLAAKLNDVQAQRDALNLAVAKARKEIDAQAEAARLAAARAEAMQALVASLKKQTATKDTNLAALAAELSDQKDKSQAQAGQVAKLQSDLTEAQKQKLAQDAAAQALQAKLKDAKDQLSAAEKQRLADAAAAKLLRDKLKNSQDELTAMTLELEAQRKKAEDTLTLLAGAQAASKDLNAKLAAALAAQDQAQHKTQALDQKLATAQASNKDLTAKLSAALAAKLAAQQQGKTQLTEAQQKAVLLAAANKALSDEKAKSAGALRKVALLNEQIAALRTQLSNLQGVLDASAVKDAKNKVQIQTLGSQLNAALARVAVEEKQRLALEEAARKAAEAKAQNLEQYRSQFFGKLRQVLKGQPGVRIVGDRFVFSSEVLFEPASATLSPEGKQQIAGVTRTLQTIAAEIPTNIHWILEVDGFTDSTPLSGTGQYRDNWELSQARALSVVHYMIDDLGFPPQHLAAAGFGQYQPVAKGDTPDARAQNRRIELKLTQM
ncbi:hypothetical protein U879_10315 [Defluviimonas sp. 20V17]|uniref:Chemotaxis protein MotB n=1 Tax=Allgaiera indica TaxID=765699 RepID=A0AAN4UPP2_9RHOB|nr:peptidoglycan -binding protein [Allgaiera indica]KDB03772.1 hypothetical protein U879_10315 [Defluviimonas sp. 20V17]GHD99965.1 flagellar motor protein [Allgaiera indica]SDW39743.1 chemotaxis protein MotB [Allgaiera indica]